MHRLILVLVVLLGPIVLIAQCNSLSCNQNTNISLSNTGEAFILPSLITTGDVSSCTLEVALYDFNNTTIVVDFKDTLFLTCEHIGEYILHIKDVNSQNICFGQIVVSDLQQACTTATNDFPDLKINIANGHLELTGLDTNVHIYSVAGEHLLSRKINPSSPTIDLSRLSTGIYLISAIIHGKPQSTLIHVW